MSGLTILFGNPSAQSGKAKDAIVRALEELRKHGLTADFVATDPEGRTPVLVRETVLSRRPERVVYLGGDGTFNEVASGLMSAETGVPLGMLPMGTANDQGKSLGVRPGAKAVTENVAIIARGHVMKLDVGHAAALDAEGQTRSERLFFDSLGWGMQSAILVTRNRDRAAVATIPILRDLYRDQSIYAGATLDHYLSSFVEPTKFSARVMVDGEAHQFEGLTDLVVNATAIYAGEWVPARFSEPDDGLFELVPVAGRREWATHALRDLAAIPFSGRVAEMVGLAVTPSVPGSRFELNFSRPGREAIHAQLDGEEWCTGRRFQVEVHPGALPVITPEDFKPPWRFG